MQYPIKLRQEVCEHIYVHGAFRADISKSYNIPMKTLERWLANYRLDPNYYKRQLDKIRPINGRETVVDARDYKELSKDELRRELMRKDIEIARLKKSYMVRQSGGKPEYGTFSD